MKLLLDTHFLIWLTDSSLNLTRAEECIFGHPSTELVCSVVSLWELRIKWNKVKVSGERAGSIAPEAVLDLTRDMNMALLPLTHEHAVTPLAHPMPHKDPFDELLLVQAQVEGLELLTRDGKLRDHSLVHKLGI